MFLTPINVENLKRSAIKCTSAGKRARKKLEIISRDNFKCVTCGTTENLTVAHIIPIRRGNRGASCFTLNNCKTQCSSCHIKEEFNE